MSYSCSGTTITLTRGDSFMADISITEIIATKAQEVTIPQGYHDGSGKVSIDTTE